MQFLVYFDNGMSIVMTLKTRISCLHTRLVPIDNEHDQIGKKLFHHRFETFMKHF